MTIWQLQDQLTSEALDVSLAALYALDGRVKSAERARKRALRVAGLFAEHFGDNAESVAMFSAPGRTEICGNHTDHQHGHVLCGSVDLDLLACAAPNGTDVVRVLSEGYAPFEVNIGELVPKETEKDTSIALIRGMAARLSELGYSLGGFDVIIHSTVPAGAGLSSSAAFEVLIGVIFNRFFCDDKVSAVEIAKAGQYAENVYFEKPCGLMDQMGSAIGGVVAIDFKEPSAPVFRKVDYNFANSNHVLCIVETGGSHADLTNDYASIPNEMRSVAGHFGKDTLRDVPEGEFYEHLSSVRVHCSDRAVLRAIHFYEDDRRSQQEATALETGQFDSFLSLVNASGLSSATCLQNLYSPSTPQNQAISLALTIGRRLMNGEGAIRVHGGGFAGTIQAFVPFERLDAFRAGMEQIFGPDHCHMVHVRPKGGCVLIE